MRMCGDGCCFRDNVELSSSFHFHAVIVDYVHVVHQSDNIDCYNYDSITDNYCCNNNYYYHNSYHNNNDDDNDKTNDIDNCNDNSYFDVVVHTVDNINYYDSSTFTVVVTDNYYCNNNYYHNSYHYNNNDDDYKTTDSNSQMGISTSRNCS